MKRTLLASSAAMETMPSRNLSALAVVAPPASAAVIMAPRAKALGAAFLNQDMSFPPFSKTGCRYRISGHAKDLEALDIPDLGEALPALEVMQNDDAVEIAVGLGDDAVGRLQLRPDAAHAEAERYVDALAIEAGDVEVAVDAVADDDVAALGRLHGDVLVPQRMGILAEADMDPRQQVVAVTLQQGQAVLLGRGQGVVEILRIHGEREEAVTLGQRQRFDPGEIFALLDVDLGPREEVDPPHMIVMGMSHED